MLRKFIIILLILCTGAFVRAQHNYLSFDHSVSQFRLSSAGGFSAGLIEKLNRCEGNYNGASFQIICGHKHYIGIGAGLSSITYQKEWLGIFSESNQFGVALLNGQIDYWSFPVSYTWIGATGPGSLNRCYGYRKSKDKFHFGLSITYIPSFKAGHSFSVITSGGADLAFLSALHSNEQSFQHSMVIGFCNQLYLFDKITRIDLEPYAGIGSAYFKDQKNSLKNTCFGLKLRICLKAKLPTISIEKEVDPGNAAEKKKLLEQKQKEIQEQIDKNKNPK